MIGLPGGDDFDTNHNGVHHWGWAEIISNKEEDWNENFTGNSRMSLQKNNTVCQDLRFMLDGSQWSFLKQTCSCKLNGKLFI